MVALGYRATLQDQSSNFARPIEQK